MPEESTEKRTCHISRFPVLVTLVIAVLFLFCSGYIMFSRENRLMFRTFFSTKCRYYKQSVFSRKLNDRLVDYSMYARRSGIKECKNEMEIRRKVKEGKLVKARSNGVYLIDRMTHSYPYVTDNSKDLLNEIARRFKEKTAGVGLKGSKFHVTSMTRTTEKMKGLWKNNGNLSDNSPHLHGNAFDISYVRFTFRKLFVTECDKAYLKEALAEVIWQLRDEKKCWATCERVQGCYHVVAR
jgi:hypothetical protein